MSKLHLASRLQRCRSCKTPQPIGRLNDPRYVFIRAASSAQRLLNSRCTVCIRKGPNMSRIAVTYDLPSKRTKLSNPANSQTVAPGTTSRCARTLPAYSSYLRQRCNQLARRSIEAVFCKGAFPHLFLFSFIIYAVPNGLDKCKGSVTRTFEYLTNHKQKKSK